MNARELMSTNLVVVPPETPVIALAELLAARGISAAPVMGADGAPLGIVTEGDLIRRLADEKPSGAQWLLGSFRGSARQADRFVKTHGKTARDVMTTDLATATEDASAEQIARMMEQRGIRRVLIVRDGLLVGLVSRADLLRVAVGGREAPPVGPPNRLVKDVSLRPAALPAGSGNAAAAPTTAPAAPQP